MEGKVEGTHGKEVVKLNVFSINICWLYVL